MPFLGSRKSFLEYLSSPIHLSCPLPKFKIGDLVCLQYEYVPDLFKKRYLLIQDRGWVKLKESNRSGWFYHGIIFQVEGDGLVYRTTARNSSEEELKSITPIR